MPGIRRSQTASRAPSVLVQELERLAGVVEGAHARSPAFSMAIAIDSREPVSSSMTMREGASGMAGWILADESPLSARNAGAKCARWAPYKFVLARTVVDVIVGEQGLTKMSVAPLSH